MGLLQNGEWVDQWYDTDSSGGEYRRQESRFRHWLTPSGEAGPNGEPGFKAEKGRYHLYVSLACPWAHRTEGLLAQQRYLLGDRLTEADWRLFTTLIRFDAVYFGHFETNRQLLADYPAISDYVRELYQVPGIAETVNFVHIKTHYYASHLTINPTGIVPVGPAQDFGTAHDRAMRAYATTTGKSK